MDFSSRCILKYKVSKRDSAWAWVTLAASTLVLFSSFGFVYKFGIFYSYFLEEFKDTKEKTAWIGSIPMCLMHLLAIIGSVIVTKYGLRFCTMVSAIPLAASLVLTSYARNLDEVFGTFSLLYGLTCCILLICANKAIYTYFDRRIPTAVGIMTGGSALAQVGIIYLVTCLVGHVGLQRTLQILAAIFSLTCMICAQAFVPTTYEDRPSEERGVNIYSMLLKSRLFQIFVLANVIDCVAYSVSSIHMVQYAIEFGVSKSTAHTFPMYDCISNAFGRAFAGFMQDFIAKDKLLYHQTVLLLAGLTAIVGTFISNQTQLIAYMVIYSFLDGNIQASVIPVLRKIVGTQNLTEGYSVTMTAVAVPVMLGPPLVGFIMDKTQSYIAYFIVAGTPHLLACLVLFALRFMKKESQFKVGDIETRLNLENNSDVQQKETDKDCENLLRMETPV